MPFLAFSDLIEPWNPHFHNFQIKVYIQFIKIPIQPFAAFILIHAHEISTVTARFTLMI